MRVAALLATVSLLSFGGMPAFAETQEQYGDSHADLTLNVDHAGSVTGSSVAGSNSYTSTADGASVVLPGYQYSEGDSSASSSATVWSAHGDVVIFGDSAGNTTTVDVRNGDIGIGHNQYMTGDSSASVNVQTGDSGGAYSSASASGNVTSVASENGSVETGVIQESGGAVSANVEADHCCVGWTASGDAVASGNSIATTGSTSTIYGYSEQYSHGPDVNARVDLYAGYAGDAVGAAAASGNTMSIDNQWGYVNATAVQHNWSDATAESYVTLGGDFLGVASASSYGVGNAANVSNVGSDTVMNVAQTNEGAIGSFAAVSGQGGDYAVASAVGYGNVVTGGLCTTCNDAGVPSLNAQSAQTNHGSVYSSANVVTAGARHVAGSAVAIGNAASYNVSGN